MAKRSKFCVVAARRGHPVMRIIAFITDAPTVRDILANLGEPTVPPRIAPARDPACPLAANLSSVPARKSYDQCADQSVAANNRWLTRTPDSSKLRYT